MKKRVLSFLLAALMVFSILPISALAETVSPENSNASVNTVNNLDVPTPESYIPKLSSAIISCGARQIPVVGTEVASLVGTFISDWFGMPQPTTTDLMNAIKQLSDMIAQLSCQIEKDTKDILIELYNQSTFDTFDQLVGAVKTDTKNIYDWVVQFYDETKEEHSNSSEEYKTLKVAELLDYSSKYPSNEIMNRISTMRTYLDGSYSGFSGKPGIIECAYLSKCTSSKLGGEAALRCAPYVNQVCNVLLNAYSMELMVLEAKQYVHKNFQHIQEKAAEEKAAGDPRLSDLLSKLKDEYKDDYQDKIDEEYRIYTGFFWPNAEEPQKLEETDLIDSVAKYQQMVEDNWFKYIRNAEVSQGNLKIEYVPLNPTLSYVKSSNDDLGIDWSKNNKETESVVNGARDRMNERLYTNSL